MSADPPRRPAAFRLDEVRFDEIGTEHDERRPGAGTVVVATPDPFAAGDAPLPPSVRGRRSLRWSRFLLAGLGGLASLAFGLAVDQLLRDLFARTDWLGWLGVAAAALAVVALLAIAIRELVALTRLRRIGAIHVKAAKAAVEDDRAGAVAACGELLALYSARPETAKGRKALAGHLGEIIDGRDLIGLAETELMLPFDEAARRLVLASAKRVSLVTAISPRALVDVLFVLAEILRLIRQMAALYGGRPGFLGFVRLARTVVSHLALTGGMAAGDSLVQQVLGHGLAARLSARLGEGVINGLLTARVGIAAIEVCRPLPFILGRPPRLGDVMAELTRMARERRAPPSDAPPPV